MTEEEKAVERLREIVAKYEFHGGTGAFIPDHNDLRTLLAAYERRGEALEKAIKLLWDHCEGGLAPHIEELEAALNQETHHG